MSYPVVSVVLPVYNAEKYIRESVESIINQTETSWELIVVDDASTDKTAEIISEFKDSRILYYRNEYNKGVSYSSNYGATIARGQYIMKQDADDISLPDRMATQLTILKGSDIDIVFGGAIFFNGTGIISVNAIQLNHQEIKARLLLTCPVMNPTLMVKRKVIKDLDYWYDEQYNGPEDYDFFCRAIATFKFFCTEKVLIKYRVHQSPDRLSGERNRDHYFNSTLQIRKQFWIKNGFSEIADKWVPVYELLFYHRNQLDFKTANIVAEFYLILYLKAMLVYKDLFNKSELERFRIFIKQHFSNHFYPYTVVGPGVLKILLQHKHLCTYSFSQYCKYLIKAFLRR